MLGAVVVRDHSLASSGYKELTANAKRRQITFAFSFTLEGAITQYDQEKFLLLTTPIICKKLEQIVRQFKFTECTHCMCEMFKLGMMPLTDVYNCIFYMSIGPNIVLMFQYYGHTFLDDYTCICRHMCLYCVKRPPFCERPQH